jgi:hypothetical protein
MLNSTIDFRSCVREIDSEDGIRSMINGCAACASESSKAGRLKSGVYPAADASCIVPRLDALQGRTNGFIREHRFLRQMSQIGGTSANNRRTFRRSQHHIHLVIDYDWGKP